MPNEVARALKYASKHHRGQTRKGSDVPYLAHLLAVSALVLEDGGSEAQRAVLVGDVDAVCDALRFPVDVGRDDNRSLLSEEQRRNPADAGARPGDDADLAVEGHAHAPTVATQPRPDRVTAQALRARPDDGLDSARLRTSAPFGNRAATTGRSSDRVRSGRGGFSLRCLSPHCRSAVSATFNSTQANELRHATRCDTFCSGSCLKRLRGSET